MPKDDKRLDLNADLDKMSCDFLKDIEAATREVKARTQADADKDSRKCIGKKDKRKYTIIIAAATIVLILVAFLVVNARQQELPPPMAYSAPQRLNPPITSRSGNNAGQRLAAPRLAPPPATARNEQPQRPPNEYANEPM